MFVLDVFFYNLGLLYLNMKQGISRALLGRRIDAKEISFGKLIYRRSNRPIGRPTRGRIESRVQATRN